MPAWILGFLICTIFQVQSSLLEECKIFGYTMCHLQTGKWKLSNKAWDILG